MMNGLQCTTCGLLWVARQRMSDTESGWCESEDGEDVCPKCWAKFDAQRREEPVGDFRVLPALESARTE